MPRPAGGRSGGRWQDKYKLDENAADGREAACIWLGQYWHGILAQMAGSLRDAGIDPIVEPDSLASAIVLAVDQLLPPDFALTPELLAGAGSTALLAQRLLRAKEIKAAQERKAKEREHAEWRRARAQQAPIDVQRPRPEPDPRPEPEPPVSPAPPTEADAGPASAPEPKMAPAPPVALQRRHVEPIF